jgi:intron-binding protein aquarius
MTVDLSISLKVRTHLVSFVIGAYQSLDNGLVRKECAPLVSISIWHNLHSEEAREAKFNNHVMLRKMWRSAGKRYDSADDETKGRLRFERSWLFTLLLDFLNRIYDTAGGDAGKDNLLYSERFLELLIDLQSQLPTRRYVNSLLQDLHLLSAIHLSPMYHDEENGLFRDMHNLLEHYTCFPIDDQTGQQLPLMEYHEAHHATLAKLQRVALKNFDEKLKILALSNYGSLSQREDLEGLLGVLEDDELIKLCHLLGFRTEYPTSSHVVRDRSFFLEVLISTHEARPTFQESVRELTIIPTERTLYEKTFLRNE